MYTNVSNICKTLIALLQRNAVQINSVVQVYQPSNSLCVFEGERVTLPADNYPCFEIEPTNGADEWATTRAQRPRYSFECTLTVLNSNEKYGVEYIATIANVLVEIMTSPQNLQLPIINETKWDATGGLWQTYILDSLVENVTFNAEKDGTIRRCVFSWFALVHEPYPDIMFKIGESSSPSIIRPAIVTL